MVLRVFMTLKVVIGVRFDYPLGFPWGWELLQKTILVSRAARYWAFFLSPNPSSELGFLLKEKIPVCMCKRGLFSGGPKRIRTAVAAFAEQSLATRPSDQRFANIHKSLRMRIERQNRGLS